MLSIANHSRGVVDFDELVLDAQQPRHFTRDRRSAIALGRFDGMPPAYYLDWLRVAAEEAQHFRLLRDHLRRQGHDYGDFPAHQGLWTMCEKTQHDIVARMALVPRTMEARGRGHPGHHPA